MLRVEGVSKKLKQFELTDINFHVQEGEYFMLLGPSGAGKTIILELLAGLIKQDSGEIYVKNKEVTGLGIGKRGIGLVFQDLAVFPNMTVAQNIGYAIRRKRYSATEVNKKVYKLAEELSISHLLKRNPASLSGGELQRVALARTLALEPKVLLLDEPLSSIDIQLKSNLKGLLKGLNNGGQTIVHVTHDYDEAISLGTNVAVVNNGKIIQTGSPVEVFQNPSSEFVASFGGIKNFFKGSFVQNSEHGLRCFSTSNISLWLYADDPQTEGFVCFPENAVILSINLPDNSAINTYHGKVTDIFQQKHGLEVWVDVGVPFAAMVTWESIDRLGISIGKEVWVSIKANSLRFIPKIL